MAEEKIAAMRSDTERMIREVLRRILLDWRPEEKDQYIYDRLYDEIIRDWSRERLEEEYRKAKLRGERSDR